MEQQIQEPAEKVRPAIVKEFSGTRAIFRTNTYAKGLDHINYMFEEAKKDFPDLEMNQVEVVEYGGDRIKRIMGIEFDVQNPSDIPSNYTELAVIHPTI